MGAGSKDLGHRLLLFLGYRQNTVLEMEQLGLESAPQWDADTAGKELAYYFTTPTLSAKIYYHGNFHLFHIHYHI